MDIKNIHDKVDGKARRIVRATVERVGYSATEICAKGAHGVQEAGLEASPGAHEPVTRPHEVAAAAGEPLRRGTS